MYYVKDYKLEPEEQPALFFCDKCNGDIYERDIICKLDGDIICEECLEDYFEDFKYIAGGEQ